MLLRLFSLFTIIRPLLSIHYIPYYPLSVIYSLACFLEPNSTKWRDFWKYFQDSPLYTNKNRTLQGTRTLLTIFTYNVYYTFLLVCCMKFHKTISNGDIAIISIMSISFKMRVCQNRHTLFVIYQIYGKLRSKAKVQYPICK